MAQWNETLGMGLQISDFLPSNSEPNQNESINLTDAIEQGKLLKIDLQKIFHTQHPNKVFY